MDEKITIDARLLVGYTSTLIFDGVHLSFRCRTGIVVPAAHSIDPRTRHQGREVPDICTDAPMSADANMPMWADRRNEGATLRGGLWPGQCRNLPHDASKVYR